jgi:RNA polymerase sigma-70 factor (ECF subfamily)
MKSSTLNFSDPTFLVLLQKQDHDAITKIVEAYSTHLFNACLGMGFAPDQAKEVCHATWATFFEAVSRFEGRSHVRTFLFGILYNKAMEHRRASKKFENADPIEDHFDQCFDDTEHWIQRPSDPHRYSEDKEIMEIIEKCLEHLPFQQRIVFTMKEIMGEDTESICNELAISSTNLRQLLFRGKGRLKKCIDGAYQD